MSSCLPWSEATIKSLNELQTGIRYGHPYTCENRNDGNHKNNGRDLGCLVATADGWVCPDCSYRQNWAHDSSVNLPLA